MSDARDSATARLAAFSAATSIYYLCAGFAVHLLNPAFSPVRNYISDYAVGAYGYVYTSAYWVTVLGCLALTVALFRQFPEASARIGAACIALFGLTYALTALFPTELLSPGEFPHTMAGIIHVTAALLGWFAMIAGAMLVSGAFARAPSHHSGAGMLRALAWLMLVALVGLFAVMGARQPFAGLAEKIFIVLREAWLIITAAGVCRAAGGTKAILPSGPANPNAATGI
jgi:hypothetical membrane protein